MLSTQIEKKENENVFSSQIFGETMSRCVSYMTLAALVCLNTPLPSFCFPARPSPMASSERDKPRKGVKNRDAGLVFLPGSKQSRAISLSLQKLFIFANRCVGSRGVHGVLLVRKEVRGSN